MANRKGQIVLLAGMAAGTTEVGGTLDASAPNGGDGGFIETSGAHVHVADAARISTLAADGKTGTWLIDPHDYTIAASGGDITGSALSSHLGSSSVTILSSNGGAAGSGNINVNDAVSWGANTLTLTAANNININAVMTAGGSAGLVLNTAAANGADLGVRGGTVNALPGGRVDFTGGSNTLTINSHPYTIITTLGMAGDTSTTSLQGIANNLTGYYALGSNIDASATSTWNGGAGFTPIGDFATPFTGTFDGLGHTISSVTIKSAAADVGLFGYAGDDAPSAPSTIRNIGLLGGSVIGTANNSNVGSLAGSNDGTISRAYATSNVSGVGDGNAVGGLVGSNCYCGTITLSYATGTVTGDTNSFTGGLVGVNAGSVTQAYATGAVVAGTGAAAGGLVGDNKATITQSYATGAVTVGASGYAGGLAGANDDSITQTYATGRVTGDAGSSIGGLVGDNLSTGNIGSSYWDTAATGQPQGAGTNAGTFIATGLSTASAMAQGSYAGWNFTTTWRNYDGHTYPLLKNLLIPLTITASNAAKTYDGVAYAGGNGVTYSRLPNANLLGAPTYGGTSQGATNAGSYTIVPSGYWSNQQGYDIQYVSGALTVNPATLLFTADAVNRLYGVANPVFTGSVTGFVGGDTFASATAGTLFWTSLADVNSLAGWYAINGSGLTALNYIFAQAPGNASALTVRAPLPLGAAWLIASLQPDSKSSSKLGALTTHVVQIVGSGVRLP
ncbi:beta strand repeat-containing protein [Paralcaligenes ureilyticus]|uniref:MBG domain-containing protein n=1 Tax=Paralcaligenes ureilyticus TaxID=627131 RepID=A0A4R3M6H0_9BURK|nr:MBG domain-containing protein [Paralcaligenes ureilyticus]TCT07117.1 hypothetical protein EDC26_107174 [Paralcaligenes ureilyticus]